MMEVRILDPAKAGMRAMFRGKQRQVMDKIDQLAEKPYLGEHKQRELYCCYSLKTSGLRTVYTIQGDRVFVLAAGPHNWAYETAYDLLVEGGFH